MSIISLDLPDDLAEKLGDLAERSGEGESAIVRKALEAFLSDDVQPRPGSFLDRAQDLAGSLEGPGDLSFNAEHMEGYGR